MIKFLLSFLLLFSFYSHSQEEIKISDIKIEGLQRIDPGLVFNNIPFEMIKDRYINELINRKMYSDDEIRIINDKLKTINDVDVLNIRKYNWNCYMLSMFYLEVLNDYEYLFEEEELKEFFNKWNEILKNNIDVNYLVRGSLKMTKEEFSQLIGISVWN